MRYDEVQEPTYNEESKVDLNEDNQDGDFGAESFDIQPAMTTQENELFYSMAAMGKDVEPTTYVLSEVHSLLKGFNGLTPKEVLASLPPLCDIQHHSSFQVLFFLSSLIIEFHLVNMLNYQKKL